MEWLRMVAAALLSAAIAAYLSSVKSAHDMDIKLAVLENKISVSESSLSEFKRTTNEAIADIADDMKTAARELITAAAAIQTAGQSQSVVNSVSTKMLDSLSLKVETHGSAIAELRGMVHGLNNQTNHRS
jgi:hypothetical protein